MRIVHTSDWHLGRRFHGVDMLSHQAAFLDHLVELVCQERPQALLVSGDVYDRAPPPVGAVELLDTALRRLAELTTVIVISGNHDSATRLGFGAALMRPQLRLVTGPKKAGLAVELADPEGGPGALVYPIPFLDVFGASVALGGEGRPLPRSHEAVLGAAMGRVRRDLDRRGVEAGQAGGPAVVVMAHAFVTGGAVSLSERDLTVGGVASVPAEVFAGADYVALGHLHGPQSVRGRPGQSLRYSGSPLAFSFSETSQVKSTAVVTLRPAAAPGGEAAGRVSVRLEPAPVPRRLAQVRGTIAELESGKFADLADAWVAVTVTDPTLPQDLAARLRRVFPHLLERHLERDLTPGQRQLARVTVASRPEAVTRQFVEFVGGARATPAEAAQIDSAMEAVRREMAS